MAARGRRRFPGHSFTMEWEDGADGQPTISRVDLYGSFGAAQLKVEVSYTSPIQWTVNVRF